MVTDNLFVEKLPEKLMKAISDEFLTYKVVDFLSTNDSVLAGHVEAKVLGYFLHLLPVALIWFFCSFILCVWGGRGEERKREEGRERTKGERGEGGGRGREQRVGRERRGAEGRERTVHNSPQIPVAYNHISLVPRSRQCLLLTAQNCMDRYIHISMLACP